MGAIQPAKFTQNLYNLRTHITGSLEHTSTDNGKRAFCSGHITVTLSLMCSMKYCFMTVNKLIKYNLFNYEVCTCKLEIKLTQPLSCDLAFSSLYLDQLLIPFFPEVYFYTCITLTKPVFLQ